MRARISIVIAVGLLVFVAVGCTERSYAVDTGGPEAKECEADGGTVESLPGDGGRCIQDVGVGAGPIALVVVGLGFVTLVASRRSKSDP